MFRRILRNRVIATLATVEETSLSTVQVILWWEKRRWLYNALVGLTGIVTSSVIFAFAMLAGTECGVPDPPIAVILAALAYGIAANVCYSVGCVAELVARSTSFVAQSRELGAALFALGTVASVFLTLTPAVILPALCILGRCLNGHW